MLTKIDVYGIDALDLERVARVIEEKFGIAFDTKNDSEMGGVFYRYSSVHNDGESWLLTWDGDVYADEEEDDSYTGYPIDLRIWDAPDMDEVRRKMAEIEEFKVVLADWTIIDNETGNVIAKCGSSETSTEDGAVNDV